MSAGPGNIIYWIIVLIVIVVLAIILLKVLGYILAIGPITQIGEEKVILNDLLLQIKPYHN